MILLTYETWRGKPWRTMCGLPRLAQSPGLRTEASGLRLAMEILGLRRYLSPRDRIYSRLCKVSRTLSKLGLFPALFMSWAYGPWELHSFPTRRPSAAPRHPASA